MKKTTKPITNQEVALRFESYPPQVRKKMLRLRQLVYDTAAETEAVGDVEETTKWGEPSYLVKGGSTIRMDWKESNPDQYAFYFNCNSKLIATFKERFGKLFKYEGNRALVLGINDVVPENELKQCLKLALTYHKCKHLPMLGL